MEFFRGDLLYTLLFVIIYVYILLRKNHLQASYDNSMFTSQPLDGSLSRPLRNVTTGTNVLAPILLVYIIKLSDNDLNQYPVCYII